MRKFFVILSGVLCVLPATFAAVGTIGTGTVVTINEENDKYTIPQTDKHYTQGLHFTVLWPDETAPVWMRPLTWLPDFGVADATCKYGFRFGQDIYTPVDTETNALVKTDRPYAGWLFGGLIRESRGTIAGHIPVLDHFEVDAGIVGSWSEADNTQIWFHNVISVEEPKGWRHQLYNEPAFVLIFDRKLLLWDSAAADDPFRLQLLPHMGVNLGTIETSLTIGTTLRAGYHIPNEFAKEGSPVRWGWYVFSGLDCSAVAYNMFLDGNVFHGSHSVAKEPVVAHFRAGLAFVLRRVEINYSYNYLSNEFKQQDKYDSYGSFNLIYRF